MMDYDQWVMQQKGILKPKVNFPILTEALYLICDGDDKKFEMFDKLLRHAYEAGAKENDSLV